MLYLNFKIKIHAKTDFAEYEYNALPDTATNLYLEIDEKYVVENSKTGEIFFPDPLQERKEILSQRYLII